MSDITELLSFDKNALYSNGNAFLKPNRLHKKTSHSLTIKHYQPHINLMAIQKLFSSVHGKKEKKKART
jgi:hypothetical protein